MQFNKAKINLKQLLKFLAELPAQEESTSSKTHAYAWITSSLK